MKMKQVFGIISGVAFCGALGLGGAAWGQAAKDYSKSLVVTRMMAFDANHDGKVTRDEVTDDRLKPLFDEADTNSDGVLTKDELVAMAAKLDAEDAQAGNNGGPGGPGGPNGGPGGPGGRGGTGGPPQPGVVLPQRLQDQLNLTADQKAQVAALQAEVDKKLAEILTPDQKRQLADMRARGPGRGGPMGGGPGGGPGGPGSPQGGPGGPMGGQSDGQPGAPPQ